MLAVIQNLDAVPGVTRRVGGHEHGFNPVVLDHRFERRIGLLAAARLGQFGTPIGKQVADGHHFNIRVVLKTERRTESAAAVSDDAHTNLPIGYGLPVLRGIWIDRSFLEAWDRLFRFLLGLCRASQPQSGGAEANGLQK